MTTILATQGKDGFVVAADSQITDDERPYSHPMVKKITKVGEYVIAGAGVSRYCDIIQYDWKPPQYDNSDIYQFMVSKFIPSMRQAHENTGYTLKDDDSFSFIVGLRGQLFYIAEDYSVIRTSTGLYGIGSGAAYGLGALATGASIRDALKISCKFDTASGGKIQIVKQGVQDA